MDIELNELTSEEQELVILGEIERLELHNKNIDLLKYKLATLSIENKFLRKQYNQYIVKHKSDITDLLEAATKGTKGLKRGIVKTAASRFHSKGGNTLKEVNPQFLLREEILESAKKDIKSGKLKHGEKGAWLKAKLNEYKYLEQGLSEQTLYRDITFK